jgi:hypothetical protein
MIREPRTSNLEPRSSDVGRRSSVVGRRSSVVGRRSSDAILIGASLHELPRQTQSRTA